MADQAQTGTDNTATAPDNATPADSMSELVSELGPNGNPIHPPQGEAPAELDSDFIMDTLFGSGNSSGDGNKSNPASGQTQGSNDAGGAPQDNRSATPAVAPAANGGEGSPQSGPSPTPLQPERQSTGADGTQPQTQAPGQQPAASAEPPAPTLSVEDRLALASVNALREENANLLERLRAAEQGGQQSGQTGAQTQQPGHPTGAAVEPLRLSVPDNIMAGIFSEDAQQSKQALDVLISAVATNAVAAAVRQASAIVDQRLQGLVQVSQQVETVKTQEEAFYGRHPQLKNELYRPVIASTTQELYREFNDRLEWNETTMDAVAARVNKKLKDLGIDVGMVPGQQQNGSSQPPQAQAPAQSGNGATPKPAPMLDATSRGAVQADAGDFIRNTFS